MLHLFSFIGRLISPASKSAKEAKAKIGEVIEDRLRQHKEHGNDWPDKPVRVFGAIRA